MPEPHSLLCQRVGDALPSLRPSHRWIPREEDTNLWVCHRLAQPHASVMLIPSGEEKNPVPVSPGCSGLANICHPTCDRAAQPGSPEDESVIITLSLPGICREVVPPKRKLVLSFPKGKLNLFIKGDTAGTGWSSRNCAPFPLLPLQISLDLLWIHQTGTSTGICTQQRCLQVLMELGKSPRGIQSVPKQPLEHGKNSHGAPAELGSPPSHPFPAVGRARSSRGAAGRTKVTARCCHSVPEPAAGASGWDKMGFTGNGNKTQPLTTPQLPSSLPQELLVTPVVLVASLVSQVPSPAPAQLVPSQG